MCLTWFECSRGLVCLDQSLCRLVCFWSLPSYQISWGQPLYLLLFLLYLLLIWGKILLHSWVTLPEDSNGYDRGNEEGWWLSLAPKAILDSTVLGKSSAWGFQPVSKNCGIWHPPKDLSCRNLSSWVPGLVLPVLFLFCKKKFYLNDPLMLDHNSGSRCLADNLPLVPHWLSPDRVQFLGNHLVTV